ncbi:MAG: hypothetical protein ACHQRK_06440 [Gemmatimonadales bacterium]
MPGQPTSTVLPATRIEYRMLPFALMGVAFWGIVLGGGFYFARRFARSSEARSSDGMKLADLRDRIAALEEALDGARRDIDRLDAGQEFTTRLLGARAGSGEGTSRETTP